MDDKIRKAVAKAERKLTPEQIQDVKRMVLNSCWSIQQDLYSLTILRGIHASLTEDEERSFSELETVMKNAVERAVESLGVRR